MSTWEIAKPQRLALDGEVGETISGSVTCDLDAFPQVRGSGVAGMNAASGRIGNGSGTLNAYAVSGAVFLLARPALDGEAGPLAEGGSET